MSWTANKVFNNGKDFVDWLDKNYGSYVSSSISRVHVHHTYKPDHSNNQPTVDLHRNMRNYHVNTNGWQDVAQHITIGKDGKIVLGRNITMMPASATGYNGSSASHPFMFETIGNFDKGNDILGGSQLDSVLAVCHYIHVTKGKPCVFHRECLINGKAPKTCPGSGLDKAKFMTQVKAYKGKAPSSGTVSAPNTETKPATVSKPAKETWSKVTGNWTGQTLKRGQYGAPVKQLQTKLANSKPPFYPNKGAKNNGIDSYYGSDTEDAVRRFQSVNGLTVDGMAGKSTYAKLGGKTTSKITSNLKVDGYWGAATTKALQKYFGTPVDGVISKPSPVVKKLQALVGVKADGLLGPNTYKAMQRRFKTPVDGKVSKPSIMVKELQRRLNAGKL